MNKKAGSSLMVDFLFPFALFVVFALSALVVILFGAQNYKSIVNHSSRTETTQTALSYVSEKLHQADSADAISTEDLDGREALVLKTRTDGQTYETFIYYDEGSLKELLVRDGASVVPERGTSVLEISAFSAEELSSGLYKITVTDENGETASELVSLRSDQSGKEGQA